jgi:hypothetical protein
MMAIKTSHEPIKYKLNGNTYSRPYEEIQRQACLPGSLLLLNAKRELQQLDRYLYEDEASESIGWSIPTHVHDRVIEPFVYRMKPKYFFTSYVDHTEQISGGILAGPFIGGGLIALATASIMGLCAPWYLVGAVCLPSLVYLISGIKCFGQGICHLINHKEPYAKIEAKIAFQRGLSCFLMALLLPLACAIAFPLELIRFVARCVMTVVDLIKGVMPERVMLERVINEASQADFSLCPPYIKICFMQIQHSSFHALFLKNPNNAP